MRLQDARRLVVQGGFDKLVKTGHKPISDNLVQRIANRFAFYRDELMHLFPGTHAVLDEIREKGIILGLVTNGSAKDQRAKILRFDLTNRFDYIQIEEKVGSGKPDERAYIHAMKVLGVSAIKCWIVGDNLEWEVSVPQRLGISAIWHDSYRIGLPPNCSIQPDHTIHTLSELLSLLKDDSNSQ